jgi:hypothetical protein
MDIFIRRSLSNRFKHATLQFIVLFSLLLTFAPTGAFGQACGGWPCQPIRDYRCHVWNVCGNCPATGTLYLCSGQFVLDVCACCTCT